MKKQYVIAAAILFSLTGCATAKQEQISMTKDTYLKEDEDHLPDWVNEVGIKDGHIVAVGIAEGGIDQSPAYLKEAAQMNSEANLYNNLPHEFRSAVQAAVEGSGLIYQRVETKLLRVSGAQGVVFPHEKSICFKAMRTMSPKRICYQQARVPVESMTRTMEMTLKKFYPEKNSEQFARLMQKEMERIQGEQNEQAKESNPTRNISSTPSSKPQQ